MKCSILLSLYEKENFNFFDQCMKSIWVDQTIKPNEIVLVLDGPIGKELQESVKQWQNEIGENLKVIALPKNVGLGKALNEGLKHCSCDWVFRMDTDDISTPNRFEKQIEFIKKNKDIVLFGGQILEFDSNHHQANLLKSVPVSHCEILQLARKKNPFNHMTVAYKKSVIEAVGGYKHHLFMEDYNLWLRVIGAGYQVANLHEVLVYARVGNGMYSRRKGLEYIKSEKKLMNLKKQLKLQSTFSAYLMFLIRSGFRIIPANFLGNFYKNFLRKSIKK